MVLGNDSASFFCMLISSFPGAICWKDCSETVFFGPYWWCKFKPHTLIKAGLDSQVLSEEYRLRRCPGCLLSPADMFGFLLHSVMAALGELHYQHTGFLG